MGLGGSVWGCVGMCKVSGESGRAVSSQVDIQYLFSQYTGAKSHHIGLNYDVKEEEIEEHFGKAIWFPARSMCSTVRLF